MFDITDRKTFVSCRSWLADLRAWGDEDLVILLVGNKGDLCEAEEEEEEEEEVLEEGEGEGEVAPKVAKASGGKGGLRKRAVSRKEVLQWVEEEGLSGYVETSAKEGTGVDEVRFSLSASLVRSLPNRDFVMQAFNRLTRTVHRIHQDGLAARKGASSGAGSSFPLSLGVPKGGCC